jgi:hypothetical protein
MATVQDLLNLALTLIDEVTENGAIATETPEYYETKAINFATIIQAELLPPNSNPPFLTSIDDELIISNVLVMKAASYGLASKLLFAEDVNLAVMFNNMYDEAKRRIPTQEIPITDVYCNGVDD